MMSMETLRLRLKDLRLMDISMAWSVICNVEHKRIVTVQAALQLISVRSTISLYITCLGELVMKLNSGNYRYLKASRVDGSLLEDLQFLAKAGTSYWS